MEKIDLSEFDKLETIGDRTFKYCSSLKEAKLPKSITAIGESAFNSCEQLEKIDLSECEKLVIIGDAAFAAFWSSSLKEAKLPKSITAIGEEAFHCCKQLEKIDLSECEKLEIIGDAAFAAFCRCSSLKEVKLPKSITAIGEEAFYSCI